MNKTLMLHHTYEVSITQFVKDFPVFVFNEKYRREEVESIIFVWFATLIKNKYRFE